MPFAPDAWPKCGINVVVNDSDDGELRKGRLELIPGAMTRGKHSAQFAVFECEPSSAKNKVSGALEWNTRCLHPGGFAELTLGVASPNAKSAVVSARLVSLDSPESQPAAASETVPVSSVPAEYTLRISTDSPPGRYRLEVTVTGGSGWTAARDALNVYIYE